MSIKESSAVERIAHELRELILDGHYPPGTRVRQEELAETLGASRLPVREALRILEGEHLLTVVANTGAWVSQLSYAECDELYQVREQIEPLLLRLSIPNLNEQQIFELEHLVELMEQSESVEDFLRHDRAFHLGCYKGAETVFLGSTVSRLWNMTQNYRRVFTNLISGDGKKTIDFEHRLLLDAVRRRDGDEAAHVLFGHIRRTRRELALHPELFSQER